MCNYSTMGKYRYKRLPMGLSNPPEISQQKISNLFQVFEFIRVCMDDILILTKGYHIYHA